MKKNIQKLDNCKRIIEIEASPQEIMSLEDEVYRDIQKVAEVSGFRKGKAPLETVKKLYKEHAGKELLKRSISEFYQRGIEEEKLFPLELPEIYDVNWQWGKPLIFKAKFDVSPEVKLKAYKGLKLKKKKVEVKDEEIEKVLKELQEKNSELAVVEPRPLIKGDFILCDYRNSIEGKDIEAKENVWLSLEENVNLPGFNTQLEGAVIGEERKINLDLPKDFPDKNIQGKKMEITVKIKEIKEKKLPVIDDEFAKTVGQLNSLAELKEGIYKDMLSLKEVQSRKELESKALEILLEANKFSVPQSMVERYSKGLEGRFRHNLADKGINKDEVEKSAEIIKKRADEESQKQVKIYFILAKIAQNEKIEITDEELDKHIENLARQWKQDFDKIKKNFIERKLLDELRMELQEEKVMELVLKSAHIEEE